MSRAPARLVTARAPRPTLSRRASLNALAALVDYSARITIQLVLAPLLLRFLGDAGYGVWQVLQKLIGHASPASGRAGEALKWLVAQEQSVEDVKRKRRQVGTAIAVWALFLPLVGVVGGVLAWVSPWLVGASAEQAWAVRGAAGLLVLNVAVMGLASVPQAVLQGENLGYRQLGLSTGILFVGGIVTALTLWAGWGLLGVALAAVTASMLSGVTYLHIVRRQIGWWGVARPESGKVKGFVALSWWFLLWNLVMQAMKGSDVIVLGIVGGVSLVTTYTLTSYVPHAITDVVFMVVAATMPGLGGLVGAGQLERAAKIRGETMLLAWLVGVSACATAIVWLPLFLDLWVGSEYDAGTTATVLICVMVLQLALIRVDSNVIDLTLRVRAKVLLGLLSALLSAGLAVLLVGPGGYGIVGLVAAFIIGRLPLTIAYPVLTGRLLAVRREAQLRSLWRPGVASVLLFAAATWFRPLAASGDWFALIGLGVATTCTCLVVGSFVGLSGRQRRLIYQRVSKVVHAR